MSSEFDIITLRGLTARGQHGVFPFEREGTQPFSVDVALWVDTRPAAAADDIDLTVSYADIAEEAVAVLTGPSVYLLETLASRVADVALTHPRVEGVEVTVHKPMAPLRQQFSDVSVTIRRGAAAGVSGPDTTGALPVVRDDDEDTPAVGVAVGVEAEHGKLAVEFSGEIPAAPGPDATRTAHPRRARDEVGSRGTDLSTWHEVVLALGGNIGDVPTTLARAVAALVDLDGMQVLDVSPLVRTRAVLAPDQDPQPDYWNAVVLARVGLGPGELLAATSAIETGLGRVRHEHWGARTLDIDIVQYSGVTSRDPHLVLPHPRARERAFVLVPWELVDSGAVLDGVGSVAELARVAGDRSGVLDAVSDWLEDPGSVAAESDEVLAERDSASVIQTPAGGSVVVAAESHPQGRPTRLDLVPEASRAGLRPSDTGEDYLWHHLWEQWEGAPPLQPVQEPGSRSQTSARTPSEFRPQTSSAAPAPDSRHRERSLDADSTHPEPRASQEVAEPDGVVTVHTGGMPGAGAGPDTNGPTAPPRATPGSATADPAPRIAPDTSPAPAGPEAGTHAGEAQDAGTGGPGPEAPSSSHPRRRRAGMWVPLRGSADHSRTDGGDRSADPAAAGQEQGSGDGSGSASQVRRTPALPDWDFITGESVRIVDDAADLRPARRGAVVRGPVERHEDPTEDTTRQDAAVAGTTTAAPDHGGDGGPVVVPPPGRPAEPPEEQTGARGEDGTEGRTPARRSILRVDLPAGTPEGPLEHDERTQTSILRG
ncbi:MAG: 2-amino-4-hydroxy-6-hydroxymethyldihydropteridine diphosphokinase, partial [Pauljensenia sp.]